MIQVFERVYEEEFDEAGEPTLVFRGEELRCSVEKVAHAFSYAEFLMKHAHSLKIKDSVTKSTLAHWK